MTAIQKIIKEVDTYTILNSAGKKLIKNLLKDKLLMEKEQILDAFFAGDNRGKNNVPFNAEQYYNQTFKQ